MLIGVVVLARASMRLPLALLLGLFGQAFVNGAAWDWWAGGSFGGRRFDSTYVVFAVGAAILADIAIRALRRSRPVAILSGFAMTAALLVAIANIELAARTSVISARIYGGDPASRVWRTKIGGIRGRLASWLSSASTAPIRVAFAWRYRVDLDADDRL